MWLSLFKRSSGPRPPSPEHDAFLTQALEEYHAKLDAANRQWRFPEGERWDLNQKARLFRLHFSDGSRVEAEVQLLGSYNSRRLSWEWAWNNPKLPAELIRDSLRVKQHGEQDAFEQLSRGQYRATDPQFGILMAAAAAKIVGSEAVFAGADGPLVLYLSLKQLRRQP